MTPLATSMPNGRAMRTITRVISVDLSASADSRPSASERA